MQDININFNSNRFTGNLSILEYKNAIKQKVRNILMLKHGDLKYKEHVYTNLWYLLGEPMNSLTVNIMKEYIINSFYLHIPETELQNINIKPDFENQKYIIMLSYTILYNMENVEQVIEIKESN